MKQISIHSAAMWGELETITKILKDDSTMISKTDEFDKTALHHATEKGFTDITKLLLENGADPNQPGFKGMNALHLACYNNQVEILKLFKSQSTTLDYDAIDESGNTPLHYSALNGSLRCTDFLLNNGANIQATNAKLATPLMMATLTAQENMIEALIKHEQCDINHADCNGDTSLHWAAKCGYYDVIRKLLALGADKNIANSMEQKPINVATDSKISALLN